MKKLWFHIAFLISLSSSYAQRQVVTINSDWSFNKVGEEERVVNLPHTYNAEDAFDDEPSYYRGKAVYQKVLRTENLDRSRKHFLRFGAVNQEATVYVNSQLVGSHQGGYTSFTLDISDHISFESDTIRVEVDNSHNESIPPLKGDFTFYGGIYRDVQLISVAQTHFSFAHYGSDGVYLDPLGLSEQTGRVKVRCFIDGDFEAHTVQVQIFKDGASLPLQEAKIKPGLKEDHYYEAVVEIDDPVLWSIDNPYLYIIRCQLTDRSGEVVDELAFSHGFREISFDANKGFFLNGKHEKLIGVNRHQDQPNIGNALHAEHHLADMELIKDMGTNFLRTAHYPQDKLITDYCDRHGILVSMEIPLDHEITQTKEFADVSKQMTMEMIHQYYNHPSVIIWAYMNEMGLGKQIDRDKDEMQAVATLAKELENLIRKEDPNRYTMIPNHGHFEVYQHFGLTEIPMLVGWNLYYGWYEPNFEGFGNFVDHAHQMVPDKPILITEYGAGADPRITSYSPERFDFSLDWTYDFHESHLSQIMERDFIAGSAVWNMFDFGSESRQDAVPHINNKGLCGFDRLPKPVYYLYQSHLRKDLDVTVPSEKPKRIADFANNYWNEHKYLQINFGTNFYFEPADNTGIWYPGEEVPTSLMKVEGGERFSTRDRGVGSDRAISLTNLDPVYQTQLVNASSISLFVPNGKYRVRLEYSALQKDKTYNQLVTLNQGKTFTLQPETSFQAYHLSTEIVVSDGEIQLAFAPNEDGSFINGIQIIQL